MMLQEKYILEKDATSVIRPIKYHQKIFYSFHTKTLGYKWDAYKIKFKL